MAQPAGLFLSRELTRVIPFASQRTFVDNAAGAAETFVAEFDVALCVTDVNQLLTGALPSVGLIQFAIGPLLDFVCFCTGAGGATALIEYAVDRGASYREFTTIIVAPNTLTNVSGLRITGRFVRTTVTNVTAGATLETGTWVRSN